MIDSFHKNKKKIDTYRHKFNTTFGVDIRKFYGRCNLIDIAVGFDIVEFDKYVQTPENKSLSEHLKEKYGEEAHEMITALIN